MRTLLTITVVAFIIVATVLGRLSMWNIQVEQTQATFDSSPELHFNSPKPGESSEESLQVIATQGDDPDVSVSKREPLAVSQDRQTEILQALGLLEKRLKDLKDENNRLKEQLQLCRSSSEATPLGVFLRLPEALGADKKTLAWMELVSEYYPIPLADGEAMALAEQKDLLTSDEKSWHQGVIDTLGVKRIVSAIETWTSNQKEKLADDLHEEEAILLGLNDDFF